MEIQERGLKRIAPLPDEALPPCNTCPKPELSPDNLDVVKVYRLVANQQQINAYSGHLLGLRIEAVIAATKFMYQAGRIDNMDVVIDRIWIIDEVACRIQNAKIDAKRKSEEAASRTRL